MFIWSKYTNACSVPLPPITRLHAVRHSKGRFFWRGQNFSFEILHKKKGKNIIKYHLICVKHEEKTVKEFKIHKSLVCA